MRYRGVLFKPGDVLLANVNLNGNGVYTSLSEPKGFSSHSAFVAILDYRGRRYPVVVETFEKGVRPVPLSVFVGPRFSSYIEVYRHRHVTPRHEPLINESAKKVIAQTRGYNFDSEDEDRSYVSCTTLGRLIHGDAGLSSAATVSQLAHPNIRRNLERLGYTYFDFFAPVDYLLDERFQCAGWIDNNQFSSLLARDLIDSEFKAQFAARRIEPDKFPFPYTLNRWGIKHIRRRTLMGRLIGLVEGFDEHSLPKGPDDLLAVITLAEKQIGKAILKTKSVIDRELQEFDHDRVDSLLSSPRIRDTVTAALDLPWLRRDAGE